MPDRNVKAIVIMNPTAGRRRMGRVARFVGLLQQAGLQVRIVPTRYRGHATTLARMAVQERACTHIVAAGGDGTVAEVAEGMAGSDIILGILPVGTANVLARELCVPFDDASNARNISGGAYTIIWPGRLHSSEGECLFVQMVGVGFDAHVVHVVSIRLKKAIGRAAYVLATLGSLWKYTFPAMTVSVDGVSHTAASVIVSKGALYAGKYVLTPRSMQESRQFSVVLFGAAGIGSSLRYAIALLRGNLSRQKDVTILTAQTVEISTPRNMPVQSDGDARGLTPIRIDIPGRALRIAL
ncbi:diacylglycerol kinase family protein [Komagataeibacter sp. FXV3]|uniref:diacylglycerol/lipid kinase family protein n=1 Tax=Komagataeibacter sp. FXV3 TaxID=2608998 RepID=UPI00187B3D3D|nr:diacylglycerol kinase family protein [Komagataeibacter sp. FXV3]MBE7728482.1 diacylglycerol kinase family lipid kinase [Komagataeibacter sp. FXV3]